MCLVDIEGCLKESLNIHKSLIVVSDDGEVYIKNVAAHAPVDPSKMKGKNVYNIPDPCI
jgi:hypothetical protein